MEVTCDSDKNAQNVTERGLSFDLAREFDWSTALIREDLRKDYGERRFIALGYIDERLHALVFTPRNDALHVISLRKANNREIRRYEQATKPGKD